jgi:hypothetical protein
MSTYNSGYITHRKRKIPIVWDGLHAQHIAEEHINNRSSHPLLHVRIQQLAKNVKEWEQTQKGSKRYCATLIDNETNKRFFVLVEIWTNFVYIITSYRR